MISDVEITEPVEVSLLAPDPETSLSELAVFPDEDKVDKTFTFTHVSIGLRAVVVQIGHHTIVKYAYVPQGGTSLIVDVTSISQTADKPDHKE